jgi:hypothetical protein
MGRWMGVWMGMWARGAAPQSRSLLKMLSGISRTTTMT